MSLVSRYLASNFLNRYLIATYHHHTMRASVVVGYPIHRPNAGENRSVLDNGFLTKPGQTRTVAISPSEGRLEVDIFPGEDEGRCHVACECHRLGGPTEVWTTTRPCTWWVAEGKPFELFPDSACPYQDRTSPK